MKKATKDWFLSAESDLLLIKKIASDETLTHLAAFHSQQSVEKSFKAIIEEFDLGYIKTHSLETLYNKVKGRIMVNIDTEMLIVLDQLYIDSRYPGAFGLLPNGKPSVSEGEKIFRFALDILEAAKSSCNK
jgi:HEPN domain-containing protein